MITTVVKLVTVTRKYAVFGRSSDNSKYYDKDFRETGRVPLGEAAEFVDVGLRETTETERALMMNSLQPKED